MSKRSRYTVSSVDDIVLSIISLVANTCSVVDLFLRYAAWDMGIAESNLELILFIIQTANIFLRTDKRIIGRRFDVGPFGFPGFCSALKIPCVISFGCFPVTAISLYIAAIFSYTTSDEVSKIMKDVFTIAFLLMLKQYYQISYQLIKNPIVQIMSY